MNNSEEHKNEAPAQNKEFEIIVNGREKIFTEKKISFTQVVELAFNTTEIDGTTCYTVTYSKGEDKKPKGTMVKGDTITVKSGMIFNVTDTDKS